MAKSSVLPWLIGGGILAAVVLAKGKDEPAPKGKAPRIKIPGVEEQEKPRISVPAPRPVVVDVPEVVFQNPPKQMVLTSGDDLPLSGAHRASAKRVYTELKGYDLTALAEVLGIMYRRDVTPENVSIRIDLARGGYSRGYLSIRSDGSVTAYGYNPEGAERLARDLEDAGISAEAFAV